MVIRDIGVAKQGQLGDGNIVLGRMGRILRIALEAGIGSE